MTDDHPKPAGGNPSTMDRRAWLWLGGIFLLLAGIDVAWLALNDRPPMWDSALHLTYALRYLHFFQAEPFSVKALLALTPYYPPLFYIALVPILAVRCGPDAATLIHLPFLLVLLGSTCWLGVRWTGRREVGLLAAFLAGTFPHVQWLGRDVLIDLEVVALTALILALAAASEGFSRRGVTAALGLACGAGLLFKWSIAFYVAVPLLWLLAAAWRGTPRGPARRRLADNLLLGAVLGGALAWPWYLHNIGFLASHFIPYTQGLGPLEGDPRLWSLAGWTFYLRALLGWHLFAPLFVLLIISVIRLLRMRNAECGMRRAENAKAVGSDSTLTTRNGSPATQPEAAHSTLRTPHSTFRPNCLGIGFFLSWIAGTYLIFSLFANKAPRHLSPVLPAVALILAAWAGTMRTAAGRRFATAALVVIGGFQAWMVSFGIPALPLWVNLWGLSQPAYQERILTTVPAGRGWLDSERIWVDGWFLYNQEAFGLWGPPRKENWRIPDILAFCARTPDPPREPTPRDAARDVPGAVARGVPGAVARDVPGARGRDLRAELVRHASGGREVRHAPGGREVRLGLVPDAARFNVWSFRATARIMGLPEAAIWRISALDEAGVCFDFYRFVLVKDGNQGPVWNTGDNARLMDYLRAHPERFYPCQEWALPDGSTARLYQNVNSVPPPPAWPPDF